MVFTLGGPAVRAEGPPGADGEASLSFYREAVGIVGDPAAARAKLLRYNGDDCRSTAVVRDWLDSGRAAEDIPFVGDLDGAAD